MNRSNVEEIKARLPIEEVIGQYIKLEKAGKSFKARCPFHNEKTASFFISPDRGGYYCFGCGAKGDIFTFVEQFEGLDFKGALKILAEKAGVTLVFDQKADSERDRLFAVTEEAAKYFESQFALSKEVQEYVKKRGIADATRQEFRIGFAPEGWSNLHMHLKKRDFNDAVIEKAGLIKQKETGDLRSETGKTENKNPVSSLQSQISRFYDRFRGRIMFPIVDSSGRVIAFSGRILPRLDDAKAAKYLNSPDTPLFDKSSVLYGLDKAKSFIRRLNYSILVEGQMDLIMSHQAGVKNTVAASGTALADAEANRQGVTTNLGLIRRLSENVIIAFDADAAGRRAALRAAGIALSLGMDVKIADIQGGKDPADLVLANPEDWKNTLRSAIPIVEFELNNVLRENPDQRKLPRILRERVFPFVLAIEGATDRAYAIRLIADRARLPEQAVRDDLVVIDKKFRATEAGDPRGPASMPAGIAPDSRSPSRSPKLPSNSPASVANSNISPLDQNSSRLDLVERRMLGLLDLMEKAAAPKAPEYRSTIARIAGNSFDQMIKHAELVMSDISFEAEAVYGSNPDRWSLHMAELVANFEEDLINAELISAIADLRAAERAGDQPLVGELAKKCQALSIRKAEVAKRKH